MASSTNLFELESHGPGVQKELSAAEAIMDLEQLEQLQDEADRMKGLGNKHMANQEYTRAYNAYSAALQLSPVGPSSHVFLSNRAAALLSLKKYAQAASDARRSVGLNPDFSKAHARLGQALYFLKDYKGAVNAYESAVILDPENNITRQYLDKAQRKLVKKDRHVGFDLSENGQRDSNTTERSSPSTRQSAPDDDKSAYSVEESLSPTVKMHSENIAQEFRKVKFTASTEQNVRERAQVLQDQYDDDEEEEEDPDFVEAKQLFDRGTQLLEIKEFRYAIDEFSAALFLCPDHPFLSFQLYVGRANAHNHAKRHEAAANDARMAIGIRPEIPHGYSLLGRSLFYLKDYAGTVIALEEAFRLMQPHDEPNIFDKAYLKKAQDALAASSADDITAQSASTAFTSMTLKSTYTTSSKLVPKLKPPRYVPREQVVTEGSTLPPMPTKWPTQTTDSNPLRVGKDRLVTFGVGSLGIKLNRGCDGFVRVFSTYVSRSDSLGKKASRQGDIFPGDILREVGGVDLRRPLTNIMWGDTVALIRMAPRPIKLIVAKELSSPPPQVMEELGNAAAEEMKLMLLDGVDKFFFRKLVLPSPVCGDEAVEEFVQTTENLSIAVDDISPEISSSDEQNEEPTEAPLVIHEKNSTEEKIEDENSSPNESTEANINLLDEALEIEGESDSKVESLTVDDTVTFDEDSKAARIPKESTLPPSDPKTEPQESSTALEPSNEKATRRRSIDMSILGGEILFDIENISSSLPILPWSATEKTRKLIHHSHVLKLKRTRFWGEKYVPRILALYRHPSVILVLRRPENIGEIKKLLNLPKNSKIEGINGKTLLESYLVAESVIDIALSKLRLSPLTTETSAYTEEGFVNWNKMQQDPRRATCFEIITPNESHLISLDSDEDEGKDLENLLVETSCWETALTYELHSGHKSAISNRNNDKGWKHQIVLGTLHSHVILGDTKSLSMALSSIASKSSEEKNQEPQNISRLRRLQHTNINMIDDDGWTALHYACCRRSNHAVALLVQAGADCRIRTPIDNQTPCHLSAQMLDDKSLSLLLGATSGRPDPNALDANGFTPMRLAVLEGRTVAGARDPVALQKCLSALEAWGGKIILPNVEKDRKEAKDLHPVSVVASQCRAEELNAVLSQSQYFFPLSKEETGESVSSLEVKFDFPIHAALISLRKNVLELQDKSKWKNVNIHQAIFDNERDSKDPAIVRTIQVLLNHGFEPNQRCLQIEKEGQYAEEINAFYGFTPLQILALSGSEIAELLSKIKRESDEQTEDINVDGINKVMKILEMIVLVIAQVTETLVKNGARVNVSQPPSLSAKNDNSAPEKETSSDATESKENTNESTSEEMLPSFLSFKRSALKLDGNTTLLNSIGGMERINACLTQWSMVKKVDGTGKIILHQKSEFKSVADSPTTKNSECAICWKNFGRVLNRKHTCRVSGRLICDDCSSKRMVENREEFRVSDGQFSLAKCEAVKEENRAKTVELEKRQERKGRLAAMQAARYNKQHTEAESEEQEKKRELFGSNIGKGLMNFLFEEDNEEDKVASSNDAITGIAASLGQTRDALNERGEKLQTLSDKTSALAEQSRDFAKMAKELRQSQQKGFFSLFD